MYYIKKVKFIAVLLIPVSLISQTVNVDEIKTTAPVEFEDYSGANKIVNTHEEIIGIGKSLKQGLKGEKYNWMNLYTIVHAIEPKNDKLNADIFIIEKAATVDTIYNVRRILSGYLQEAYGYSYEDAFTLATFITYYNAVYRGNMEYFEKKYSKKVLSYLSAHDAGLARSYKEWHGKSHVVIPLSNGNSRLDTSNITDKNVISNLKNTEGDRGVADRKKIVAVKKDDLKKDQKELAKKTEDTKKKEKEIVKKEVELNKKKAEIEKIPDKDAKEAAKKELVSEEKALENDKKDLNKNKEEIKKDEQAVKAKEAEIKEDEKEIKKDENLNELEKNPKQAVQELEETKKELKNTQEELKKEKDSIMKDKLYYLKVIKWEIDGHYDNDLIIIDPKTRKVIVRSPVERIDCSKYLLNEKGVVVILHNESKPTVHNLALLDKDNLTLIKKGEDDVFWRSFIEDRDGFIYVIVSQPDGNYLGRFTYDLKLEKVSSVKMDRDSFISFFEDTIYINRSDKNIIVLDKKDLSFVEEIKP
ncbi:MAG: hypothetical protein OEV78_06710 [Spirochaetia bacterium]|nr:hypothetical protein [Spirochaetia bacterium]